MTSTSAALPLDSVNRLVCDGFVAALGRAFEHSPWVAQGAWAARPFGSIDALHAAMITVVRRAPRAVQIAFLGVHPELAGREAEAGSMTNESVREQASAGLDALSRAEMAELRLLNLRYRARHGFPFIVAVRQHGKAEIFELLRRRMERDTDTELIEAMAQIEAITRLRVRDLVRPA